jgi:endoglucanase
MTNLAGTGRGESRGTSIRNSITRLPAPSPEQGKRKSNMLRGAAIACLVVFGLRPEVSARAEEASGARSSRLALTLDRGICIDRQVHSIPPTPDRVVHADDVHLVRTMGFDFVKLIFNPVVFKCGDGLDTPHMSYFDQVVNYGVAEKLPVVVCIHPEWKYKEQVIGKPDEFASFLGFMKALSGRIASRWSCDQVALQLMTEPPPASTNRNDWNYWGTLQRRLWQTVRAELPKHTLILSGDMGGSIEGLEHAAAVEDENVLYTFTFYEPTLFAWQGDAGSPLMHCLKGIPFPSGPDTLAKLPTILAGVPSELREEVKRRVEEYAAQRWDADKVSARIAKLDAWRRAQGGKLRLWCAEFGCHQGAPEADRRQYIELMRTLFDRYSIGWSYWSFNEDYAVMTANRTPSGPANEQTPDKAILHALMPDKYPVVGD